MDMRAGTETALARVIAVFGAAQPHCAYLFANLRDVCHIGRCYYHAVHQA
ncbi:transposase [Pseudomonas sp. ST1]|nr:transposase [Pseudomonas sp. ST1]